jgi:hypothetical protein
MAQTGKNLPKYACMAQRYLEQSIQNDIKHEIILFSFFCSLLLLLLFLGQWCYLLVEINAKTAVTNTDI